LARKILLADDSVTAQNMGRKILADAGYEVITVNNGSAALKKIGEQHPDLIVLDVYMPGYSGLEVCQRIKEAGDTSRIPILLTVGKLEPFKPEEAKRAHADGFIVKPFEASELLSALSKLEDKVVPRGETTKTGRFARATAAIEESRYDKSMNVEHDSSWKTRIAFPKKKEERVERETVEPAVYNPVNKDLRTTVEHARPEHPAVVAPVPVAPALEESRVDLGALAPAGLPKDVTPEEIAALAAAAAQVKGIAEEKPEKHEKQPEPVAEVPVVAPIAEEAPKLEVKAEASVPEPVAEPVPEIAQPSVPEATFAAHEPKQDTKDETKEKTESKEPEPEVKATPAEVMAAISSLETEDVQTAKAAEQSETPSAPKVEEPVTMAVTAPAHPEPAAPRWTAVAVGLAPEESGISLEQEMRRVYAAYSEVEADKTVMMRLPEIPANLTPPTVEAPKAAVEPVPVVPAIPEAAPTLAVVTPPAEVAPEAKETMAAVANVATDAVQAAVAELESVAAAYVAEKAAATAVTPVPEAPATREPEPPAAEVTPIVEAKVSEAAQAETAPQIAEAQSVETEAPKAEAASAQVAEITSEPASEESKKSAPVVEAVTEPTPKEEASVTAAVEVPEVQASESETSEEPALPVRETRRAGGSDEMAKRESETAAAWASWRKIRESGDSKSSITSSSESEEATTSKDAAMAVAAGAEHNPEDAAGSLESDPEIASIVDSVLADMRPKIVDEIARKLGKKK